MNPLPKYVKVKLPGRKTIYLENSHTVKKGTYEFLTGYQISKSGDPILNKEGGDILHFIQVGPQVIVVPQTMNKFYGELENEL